MSFESMARLPDGGPHTEPNTFVNLWVTEKDLQGMTALAHWLSGYESGAAGLRGGQVPGHHELVMFLRRMNEGLRAGKNGGA